MINYVFDLGINGNVPQQEALQMGLVTFAGGSPAPGNANFIAVGDQVVFNLFDLNSPPLITTVDPTSSLWFLPVGNANACPFVDASSTNSPYVIPAKPSNSGSGGSVIFGPNGNFPTWALYAGNVVASGTFDMVVVVSINNYSLSYTIETSFTVQEGQ